MRPIGWLAAALALATAACGGSGKSGSGGAAAGTPITCAWFTGSSNCWKPAAAAATACTDDAATGTFNADTSVCTYADGTSVRFDPSWSASVSYASRLADPWTETWDFTVLTSTAASCADFRRSGDGITLTTRLGTFVMAETDAGFEFTCPDGGRYSLDGFEYLNCLASPPGIGVSRSTAMLFSLANGSPGDLTLWKCQ